MKAASQNFSAASYSEATPRTDEILGFIAEFVGELSIEEDIIRKLPQLLDIIGRYLNVQRITLTLGDGSLKQELEWTNEGKGDYQETPSLQYRLKKSGPENKITFFVSKTDLFPEASYRLISALLDFNLSAYKVLAAEHSQRQLAESINNISKILTSTLDRDELLSLFVDQLENVAPYDSASVFLLEDGVLNMRAAKGYENYTNSFDMSKVSFPLDGTYLMTEVISGDEPVVLNDTRKSQSWTWAPTGEHMRSWMGVPLIVEGNVIGLFSIDKAIPNFFTEKHAQLASALAKHAALALGNALLFAKVRDAHKEVQGLSAKNIEVQENVRQRMAIELHDHTGQALLALRAELQVLRHHMEFDREKVQEHITYLDQIVLDISKDMERLTYDLRPPALSDFGIVTALEQYINEFSRRMDIGATFVHDTEINRLPEGIELVCYRIVQEALTNLVKHSQANQVEVTLNYYDNVLYLVVKDNGIGFEKFGHSKGFGLVGIRERLSQIKGNLEIRSKPGQGTELVVTIPIQKINDQHE